MTKKEWVILCQGVVSCLLLYMYYPELCWKIVFINYCFGFVYEASMHGMFSYHSDLVTKRCVKDTELNLLFPLGWNLIFSLSMIAADKMGSTFYAYIISALVVGNTIEITFHALGYWTYNYDSWYWGLFKPFRPKVVVLGIPLQVMLGYSVVGVFVWFFSSFIFF
jgi:hypothetical protein